MHLIVKTFHLVDIIYILSIRISISYFKTLNTTQYHIAI